MQNQSYNDMWHYIMQALSVGNSMKIAGYTDRLRQVNFILSALYVCLVHDALHDDMSFCL